MLDQTKNHLTLAMTSDPEIDGKLQKKVFALLENKPRKTLIPSPHACEILDCATITLRRLEKRGHIHAIRLSARKIRWDLEEIQHFADYGIQEE